MSYWSGSQTKEKRLRSKRAIDLAMNGRWQEAVNANQSLIEDFPNDADAYNRLGRAYLELGDYKRAVEAYRRAAEVDPHNVIARKNLSRLSTAGEQPGEA